MQHALIDADILNYRIGFATNDESESVAIRTMAHFLEELLLLEMPHVSTWELHLTGKNNFRIDVATTTKHLSLIHIPSPRDGLLSRMPSSA